MEVGGYAVFDRKLYSKDLPMKIPEVSLITLTCHHHYIHSLSPPPSFTGNFAVSNNLIWMYKGALFKLDASVFFKRGTPHQQALLKKRSTLATYNPSLKSFATSQGNLPPPICWKLKYQFPTGKVHALILLNILNPLGFSPGEFWQCMLDFRENGIFVVVEVGTVCFTVSTDNKFWLQLFLPT